jgi:tetratricopeptide (TPR) repeat protein
MALCLSARAACHERKQTMSRSRLLAMGTLLGLAFAVRQLGAAPVDLDRVLDGFVAALRSDATLAAKERRVAVELVQALRSSPDDRPLAITEALRLLRPEFKQALAALGEDNLGAAIVGFGKLRGSDDPYLAAEAAFYLARAYLLDERFEDALPLLTELETQWRQRTVHGGEVLFLRGVAAAALLDLPQATAALEQFLREYPDASERMRIGAQRQLAQLQQFQAGTLTDVHLRMDYSRRKLALYDTGQQTREQQSRIIDILGQLIKQAEERECNCRGGGGGGQSQKQGQAGEAQGQARGEGEQGGTQGGGSRGIDADALKRLHRGGPQSPWSQLRDRSRDPVYSAIKEKFPARYQQLIEQYYRSFQEEDGGR